MPEAQDWVIAILWRDIECRFFSMAAFFWQANDSLNTSSDSLYLWIALAVGLLGLIAALVFARSVLGSDNGTPEMQRISDAIRQGRGRPLCAGSTARSR